MTQSTLKTAPRSAQIAQTFQIDPFDIMMHADETGVGIRALQSRIASWLSTLTGPARFISYQFPATLQPKVDEIQNETRRLYMTDPTNPRAPLLEEYRRFYEDLEKQQDYQRSSCFMTLWSDDNARALASGMSSAFETGVRPASLIPLFEGQYVLSNSPVWHLNPIGRPGGRLKWAMLTSYEFMPSLWSFFQPIAPLLNLKFPMAMVVDFPKTYDRNEAIDSIESIILAYTSHLSASQTDDSRAVQRIKDCRATLQEINEGDALHDVQISLAISAPSDALLRQQVREIVHETRAWFKCRDETGLLLTHAVSFFTTQPSKQINTHPTPWPITSRAAAILLAPLGYRKLSGTNGVLRGEASKPKGGGMYPFFYDSWNDKRGNPEKRATHEIWVGMTGSGKTFYSNCYLSREYIEKGILFDMLEPMGHGELLARALNLPWFVLSAERTKLNPHDVMFPRPVDQKSHVIRLYETFLGRPLTGSQRANLERGLLGQALDIVYSGYPDLTMVTPDLAPTVDVVVNVVRGLGDNEPMKRIARDLSDEVASLLCGTGPFAEFANGQTNIDLSFRGKTKPRVFSFHEMEGDPILQAVAYTQVLSGIRRDSLADDVPRIIAVDEVFRLMRHPSLLEFLIEAAKTFRTRRKKLISIDQNMSIFLEGRARLVFENSPIRVIFNQKQGISALHNDQAFRHFNEVHLNLITTLGRGQFLMDIQDQGIYLLNNRASFAELNRFGSS